MKRLSFVLLFSLTQVCIIILHMNKHFMLIKQSFAKQKQEKIHKELITRKEQLEQQLCLAQNLTSIKQYAQEALHMYPLKVSQINRVHAAPKEIDGHKSYN